MKKYCSKTMRSIKTRNFIVRKIKGEHKLGRIKTCLLEAFLTGQLQLLMQVKRISVGKNRTLGGESKLLCLFNHFGSMPRAGMVIKEAMLSVFIVSMSTPKSCGP